MLLLLTFCSPPPSSHLAGIQAPGPMTITAGAAGEFERSGCWLLPACPLPADCGRENVNLGLRAYVQLEIYAFGG
jgi:hypothetical protein